jgi:hypothetical protein
MTVSVIGLGRSPSTKSAHGFKSRRASAKNILISATHTHSGPEIRKEGGCIPSRLIEGCVAALSPLGRAAPMGASVASTTLHGWASRRGFLGVSTLTRSGDH